MQILSKKDKKKRRFKGFDWTELAEMWGIQQKVDEDSIVYDDNTLNAIRKHISDSLAWDDEEKTHKLEELVGSDMRNYLYAMLKHRGFGSNPIYAALYTIDNDEVFAQYFCKLLPRMWT